VPAAERVVLLTEGSSSEEVNPLGPVHEYTGVPVIVVEVRFSVAPSQTGELLPMVGLGVMFTTTFTVEEDEHPPAVTVTV
jgi:hypothetical protein